MEIDMKAHRGEHTIEGAARALIKSGHSEPAHELTALAPDYRELVRTAAMWQAVTDALDEVRPGWNANGHSFRQSNAVAAIRSMAAQCSAQATPAATLDPLPAISHRDIGAALYACDWSNVPIGNKVIIRAAIEALSRGYAPQE